jgi:hypothetical protein
VEEAAGKKGYRSPPVERAPRIRQDGTPERIGLRDSEKERIGSVERVEGTDDGCLSFAGVGRILGNLLVLWDPLARHATRQVCKSRRSRRSRRR